MKRLVVLGFCLVAAAELLVLLLGERRLVLGASGIAAMLLLLGFRRLIGRDAQPAVDQADSSAGDALRHWLSHTQTMIHWAESTRTDWDRHWRPILARRFENATGQSRAKGSAAFNATGHMLFGAELWGWVDPSNISESGTEEPGPGRVALEQILQRLEQV